MSGLSVILVFGLFQVAQPPAAPAAENGSFLFEPAYILDHEFRGLPAPYALQPGDICFAVNQHIVSRIGHQLSGAGLPNHSMIVFAFPDGRTGIMEAGPHSKLVLEADEAYSHLGAYENEGGRVWVRRRKAPLTSEQSAALTRFCVAQDGKPFPVVRLVGQLSVFRSRGPIRTAWTGLPDLEKRSFFCSELVLTSLIAAGVLPPEPFRPSATYPSDLFYSASFNVHVDRGVKLLAEDWDPPARWVSAAVIEEK